MDGETASRFPALTAVLFVPGDRPERFATALGSGADAVIVDLEDAVAPAAKDAARDAARAAFAAGLDAFVRINSPSLPAGRADLAALAELKLRGIMVPKATLADIAAVAHGAPVIALIESARGFVQAAEIAAQESVAGLAFGAYDFSAEMGSLPLPEVLQPFRAGVVLAARLAGKIALDAPCLATNDRVVLREEALRSRAAGFDGKLSIHPSQIATIQEAFAPDAQEIARARAVVAAVQSGGVAVVDGMMVDAPVLRAARRVLARLKP
jgi:citrate lyase subunit beta/citryl-CoA lyase